MENHITFLGKKFSIITRSILLKLIYKLNLFPI